MGSFQDALRSRLAAIDSVGQAQTTWEKMRAAREQSQKEQDRLIAMREAQNQGYGIGQQNRSNLSNYQFGNPNASDFNSFRDSIARKESSNNYGARNASSGAMGKYQIMPSNLGGRRSGWDYEALGYDVTPQQFMASPQIQEKIAGYKLQEYYNRYGPAGAAIAWYAGPNAAQNYARTGYVSTTPQGKYPSIYSYMNSVLGR